MRLGLIYCVESDFPEKLSLEDILKIYFIWSFLWSVLIVMLKARQRLDELCRSLKTIQFYKNVPRSVMLQ